MLTAPYLVFTHLSTTAWMLCLGRHCEVDKKGHTVFVGVPSSACSLLLDGSPFFLAICRTGGESGHLQCPLSPCCVASTPILVYARLLVAGFDVTAITLSTPCRCGTRTEQGRTFPCASMYATCLCMYVGTFCPEVASVCGCGVVVKAIVCDGRP